MLACPVLSSRTYQITYFRKFPQLGMSKDPLGCLAWHLSLSEPRACPLALRSEPAPWESCSPPDLHLRACFDAPPEVTGSMGVLETYY